MNDQNLEVEKKETELQKNIIKNPFFIIVIVFIFALIPIFLFIQSKNQNPTELITPSITPNPTEIEENLPVDKSVLKEPMIYQWKGSVEGKLISKTENTFTLEKNGRQIVIKTLDNYSEFTKIPLGKNIVLKDIPLQANLIGTVLITEKKNIIAEMFTWVTKEGFR